MSYMLWVEVTAPTCSLKGLLWRNWKIRQTGKKTLVVKLYDKKTIPLHIFYWKLSAIFWISICGYFYESSQVDLKINSVITYLFFLNKNRKYIIVPHLNITSYKVSLCISLLISFYKILIKAVTVFDETNFLSNLS